MLVIYLIWTRKTHEIKENYIVHPKQHVLPKSLVSKLKRLNNIVTMYDFVMNHQYLW